MTRLPNFSPRLDERLSAEFLAHSVELLPFPTRQDNAILSAAVLRFERPEPPRDPDLPLLPRKVYPRPEATLVEATMREINPPPPVEGFLGRKAEIDQAAMALLAGRAAIITGESGVGKTALLRQIAVDPRLKKSFKRVWWFEDMQDIGAAIGLALNAPGVLRAEFKNQPQVARDFLVSYGIMLIVDHAEPDEIPRAMAFAPSIAIGTSSWNGQGTRIQLEGLTADHGTEMLMRLSNQPENVARPLATLVGNRPRALEVMATLMVEDGVTPQGIAELLETTNEDRLDALYSASFEALPEDYQALCRVLAATPRGWIAIESILAHYEKPIVGQRALTFLEKRRFIERAESKLRAAGSWVRSVQPSDEGFPIIVRPATRFLARSDGEGSTQAAVLHDQGVALMDECKDDEAELILKEALALRLSGDTDHAVAETLTALARAAYLQGDDNSAIRNLESAAERLYFLRDEESLEVIRLALARAYRRAGRLDAALAVLSDDAPPEDLTAIYRARGEWNEAISTYQRWLEKDPDSITVQYGLAETYAIAGRYDDAIKTLIANEKLNSSFEAQFLRGMIHHMQGNTANALDIYTRIRLQVPSEWRAAFARAYSRALASMGETHDAALIVSAEGVWYEAKLPRPIFARQKLSQALAAHFNMTVGKLDEAERAAAQAQAINNERPDLLADAIVHRVLGCVAWQRGDWDVAITEFDNEIGVRNVMPNRDEQEIGVALHNIADVLRQRGETERAIANYRRALTHKDISRDFRSTLFTRMSLRTLLAEVGRIDDAIDAGQITADTLLRYNAADLQYVGYVVALQAQILRETQREPRATQLLDEWINRLASRVNEGLAHNLWAVRALSVGLYVRSLPDVISAETIVPVELAENTLRSVEAHVPDTWVAWAARRDLGLVYLRLERWQEAYDTLTPLFNGTVNEISVLLPTHKAAARAASKLELGDAVVTHFDAARELEPDTHLRGVMARELADFFHAEDKESHAALRYVQALDLLDSHRDPAVYVETWVALAYTRLRLRRFNDAIDTFEQTLKIIDQLPTTDPALTASVLYDMGNAHYTLGQYKRAAGVYQRAVASLDRKRDPERSAATLTALAHCYVAMDQHKLALEAYHEALQFEILSADERRTLLVEQADVFTKIGLLQAAVDAYRSALALEGGQPEQRVVIHRGLGTLYAQLNLPEQASAQFESALAVAEDEQTGTTLLALGDMYRAQGQSTGAVTVYKRALDSLDRNVNPVEVAAGHRALGEINLEDGQLFDALKHLETALDLEKGLSQQDGGRIVQTLRALSHVHELRGEGELATRRHHEALVYQSARYTPEGYVDTLSELGRLYAIQRRLDESVKAYEEALGTEANQPHPNQEKVSRMTGSLADVYRAQGRLEDAAKLYKQVMKVMHSQNQIHERSAAPAPDPAVEPLRAHVAESLQNTESDIARHIKTLEVADQSWTLLTRVKNPDIKQLAFIRALQAQACAALGRKEESRQRLDDLIALLRKRRAEVTPNDPRPALQALALLVKGQDDEDGGNLELAKQSYRQAITVAEQEPKPDAALIWVLRYKAESNGKRR